MAYTTAFIRKHLWLFVTVLAIFYIERIGSVVGSVLGPVFAMTRTAIEMAMR